MSTVKYKLTLSQAQMDVLEKVFSEAQDALYDESERSARLAGDFAKLELAIDAQVKKRDRRRAISRARAAKQALFAADPTDPKE